MTSLRDVILEKAKRDSGYADYQRVIIAYMIDPVNNTDPRVSGRPGFVWVREVGLNGAVHQAFNPGRVRPGINMPVKIGFDIREPWRWTILEVYWELIIYSPEYDPNDPMLGLHAPTHAWPDADPGPDPVFVHPRAMYPLHVFPGTGMTIHIAPIRYEFGGESVLYTGVTDLDISAYIPSSGYKNVVLVYLDAEGNTEALVAGTEVSDSLAVPYSYPSHPANSIAAAYIRLTDSHTQVLESDIDAANQVLHMSLGTEDNSPYTATAVGQVLYSLDGSVFTAEQPVVDFGRWIGEDGILLVV